MIETIHASAIVAAVSGGVFFAFSSFVMRALGRLEHAEGIRAMQSINVVVINPGFFAVFFGAGLLAIVTLVLEFAIGYGEGRTAIVLGTVAYLAGCIGVTVVGNVPLNDRLAAVDADSEEGASLWTEYLDRWTIWNHVRTGFCIVAAVAFVLAARVQ